jgi:hypothetical protein
MYRKSLAFYGLKTSAVVCLFVITMVAVFTLSGCGGSSGSVSVAVTASATTVDATDAVTTTATVTNDGTPGGVTWSVSGGGALSNETTTGATYTAPAASNSALTVTVTATSVADTTKTGTVTLTIPAAPAITTGALAAGAVGTAYSQTMAASGGIPTYSWTLTSGTLPACLTMNSAGVISGTPTASCAGTTNLTFKVTDSGTATALSATSPALGLTINAAPAITFTGTMPATATYESSSPYAGFATATGGAGALTYSVSSGLPPGLILMSTSNGQIGGTPTAVGSFSFTVKAADPYGDSATQGYTITVSLATPTLTFAAIPSETYGNAPFTVSASSASSGAVTYSVTSGPATISGNTVTLTGAGTVVLGASQAATTNYTAATASASFTVNPEVPTLTFAAIPTETYGNAPFTVSASSASSGAITYSVTSGPATIVGNTVTLTGAGPVVLGASQAATTNYAAATASISFTVSPETVALSFAAISTHVYGDAPFQVSASDATGPVSGGAITYSVTSGPATVSGAQVTLTGAGTVVLGASQAATTNYAAATASISFTVNQGTPTLTFAAIPTETYGSAPFTVSASSTSSGAVTYSVTSGPATISGNTVTLTGVGPVVLGASQTATTNYIAATASASFTVSPGTPTLIFAAIPTQNYGNAPFTASASSASSGAITYSVTSGQASINSSTGLLTLTGVGTVVLGASQAATADYAAATASTSFTVNPEVPTLVFEGVPNETYGDSPFSVTAVSASSGAITYSVISGPATINSSSGVVTLTGAGTVVLGASQAASGNYAAATATISFTVNPALSITTTSPLPNGVVGSAYSQRLTATGGYGSYQWSTNSAGTSSLLGVGLSLSAAGVVSGTPTANGTATFTATVTDSASHTANVTFTVTVSNLLTVTTTSLPPTDAGIAYSQQLAAAGGSGTGYSWSTNSAGTASLTAVNLTLSSTGAVQGTPAAGGVATFTAKVTDSASNTATAPLTITVWPALTLPAPNPASLVPAVTSQSYSGTISVTGGSGSYSWAVTGLPAGLGFNSTGNPLTISGTAPSTTQTITLNVTVTDTTTSKSTGPIQYTIAVNSPTPLALPASGALPGATTNQVYYQVVNASGGSGSGYVFTVNAVQIPITGDLVTVADGIGVYSTGGTTLTVNGIPTTAQTVSLIVSVKDGANDTAGPSTYTIAVTPPTPLALPLPSTNPLPSSNINQPYTGFINASGGSGSGYVFTVNGTAIPTTGAQTAISTSDGLSGANTGGNTLSISGTPTTLASVTLNVTVTDSASDTASESYTFSIVNPSAVYSVSGTVSYSGSKTGWIYLKLNSSNCGNCNGQGTAIATKGAFTINGVPTGTYTLQAWMDGLGYGVENASDPSTNLFANVNVTVSTGNVTGVAVALGDPGAVTLSGAPTVAGISPISGGAFVTLNGPLQNNNGVETPASYTVQWNTSSSFNGTGGSKSFAANGGQNPWIVAGIPNGGPYYFRVQGVAGSSTSNWSATSSAVTIGAPTGGNTVSGTVTLPSSITPTGTLYAGFYDQNTGNIYATVIPGPSNTTPNSYSVQVPTGSNYYFFGLVDQSGNGLFGPGDISNTNESNTSPVAINPSIPSTLTQNLTLPGANALASVRTQSSQQTNLSGTTSTGYGVDLRVDALYKLPAAVQLYSGPSYVFVPTDIATGAFNGNDDEFDYSPNINGSTPSLSDVFTLNVTYSDSTPGTLTASPSALLSAFATNLTPTWNTTGVSTTPTFTWSYPANAGNYTYQFQLQDSNYSTVWQIPSNNSKSNGFSSSITPSITWGVDPTGGGSTPSVSSLNSNSTYQWQIQVTDANGNEAITQVSFQTPEAALALPTANSNPLGTALVSTPYSGSINATGGSGSGVFTVNGTTVPTTGSGNAVSFTGNDGLYAYSTGSDTLYIVGTPTTAENVSLTVSVIDSFSDTASATYTLPVISGPNGANNKYLSGTYVCKIDGYYDSNGARWAALASFQAGGTGTFTNGVWDQNSRGLTTEISGTMTGTYNIGADNNGLLTMSSTVTSGGSGTHPSQFAIALNNTNPLATATEFRMVESDDVGASPTNQHGTADCYLANTSVFGTDPFSGNSFVFDLNGENGSGIPQATLGRLVTSSGSVTGGIADEAKVSDSSVTTTTVTGGSYTTPDATNGRSTLTFTVSGESVSFEVYTIDANRMFMIQTTDQKAQVADVRKQLNAPYSASGLNGSSVTYEQGFEYSSGSRSVTGYDSMVLVASGNGTGVGTVNQIYQDENGTYQAGQGIGSTSTTSFDSSNPGRATMTVTGSTDTMIAYYFNTGSAFQFDFNASGGYLATGWTEPQSGTFTDAAVAGNYLFGQLPRPEPTSNGNAGEVTLSNSGNLTGGITTAGVGDFSYDESLSMTYIWDTTVTGTGSFLVGSGSKGMSCIVISSTKDACIFNGDDSPSVAILQQ